MEVAGLALALASLYSACIETAHRIESYKNFQSEAGQLSARYHADKALLQQWGDKVGILSDRSSDAYDRRLDSPGIGPAVKGILWELERLLKATESRQSKIHYDGASNAYSARQVVIDQYASGPPSISPRRRDRFAWTFGGKSKFATLVDTFDALVERLDDLVPIEKTHPQQQSLAKQLTKGDLEDPTYYHSLVEQALRRFKVEDMKDFRDWIAPVQDNARYEYYKACRTPNTCSWIFERHSFIEWSSSSFPNNTSKLLWIHGPAGFGKSVICAAVIDYLRRDEPPQVVYHFLSSSPDQQNNITTVLRSWIAQMVIAEDRLLDTALEEVHKAPLGAEGSNLWKLFKALVQDNSGWTFVLDGLDEFGFLHISQKRDRGKFLKELWDAVRGTPNRMLIVSRDEYDIRLHLSASATEAPTKDINIYEHQISIADVEDDVLAFSKNVVDSRLANKAESDKAEIAETIAAKCEGMFLWIDLHRDDLRAGKKKEKLKKAIEEMPIGLDSIYERNWNEIARLSNKDRSRALNILRWAISAINPLTVAEISDALLVPDDDEFDDLPLEELDPIDDIYIDTEIVGLCGSFLEVSQASPNQSPELRVIRLRHFSVREFLFTKNVEMKLSSSNINKGNSSRAENNYLATVCLRYLMYPSVQEDLKAQDGKRCFIDYAVQFWPRHLSRLGLGYSEVSQMATNFFSDAPYWRAWRSRFHQLQNLTNQEEGSDGEVKINESDSKNLPSPMYYAALFGLRDTIDHLHSDRPDSIDEAGGIYGTPTKAAYNAGHSDLVTHLISLGADLNIAAGRHGTLLGQACHNGDIQLCRFLLARDVSLEAVDGIGRTPLFIACCNGHADILKLLVKHHAKVGVSDSHGFTPINAASSNGYVEIVKQLFDYGTDITLPQKGGITPFYEACLHGHLEIVQFLFKHGANISTPNIRGYTPINAAAEQGHIEVVKQLLEYNADISIVEMTGQSPLYTACVKGHLGIVRLLLDRGADISVTNTNGWTSLNAAMSFGHTEIVRLLIEREADISVANSDGWTALYTACLNGHLGIARLLIDRGADISVTNTNGWTPLNAATSAGHTEIVRLLIEYEADISIANNDGWTALHSAADIGHTEIVKLLIERGANVLTPRNDGGTPIHMASAFGSTETVKLLIKHKADIAVVDNDGSTPLHFASTQGGLEVVKLLIDHGADVSIADNFGNTPLHIASEGGHLDVAKYLLAKGSNPRCVNRRSMSSLHLAAKRDDIELVDLLIAQDCKVGQMDDFGRTWLDWAVLYPDFVSSREWASQHVPTPKAASHKVLRKTIARLLDQEISEEATYASYVLGKCLLFVGDEPNASFALDQRRPDAFITCNRCDSEESKAIRDPYVCRSCLDTDLCEQCFKVFCKDKNEKPWRCHSHDFFHVLQNKSETSSDDSPRRDWREWLVEMREQNKKFLE